MTITIKTMEEANAIIKDGILAVNDDLVIEVKDFFIDADIAAWNIKAKNIEAKDISAWNIDARNIKAGNIEAWNIDARNIDAVNIDAVNIDAGNIDAWNIDAKNIDAGNIDAKNIAARNIKAGNIEYYAVCFAYNKIVCKSIKGRRGNSKHFCLDSEIVLMK
jgi:hypothetical protein